MSDDSAVVQARALVAEAVARLVAERARDEALAEWAERRSLLGLRPRLILRQSGRVWRLGALLVTRSGELFSTGITTRVTEPGRPQNLHGSVEERRGYRAAALKAGYPLGEVVNHGVAPIVLDAARLRGSAGPLILRDDGLWVRWSRSSPDAVAPFASYLAERVELCVHPPEGAN